eukprot:TRINITY_DN2937_c0_g4_i1.p2 TRINITY_DN2937_c0_g4~~TRINITY_DN2937_c0_g4_i1.p2  ORF type:complete len:102 (+),score=5.40 TRINITY_DN2937_c0_g4_i1:58-363(+)
MQRGLVGSEMCIRDRQCIGQSMFKLPKNSPHIPSRAWCIPARFLDIAWLPRHWQENWDQDHQEVTELKLGLLIYRKLDSINFAVYLGRFSHRCRYLGEASS